MGKNSGSGLAGNAHVGPYLGTVHTAQYCTCLPSGLDKYEDRTGQDVSGP